MAGQATILPSLTEYKVASRQCLSSYQSFSFLYTIFSFSYYTLIYISFSLSFNLFVLITHRLFKSSHNGTTLLHLLRRIAPAEEDNLSATGISMPMSAWYLWVTMIVEMTILNQVMSLSSNHPTESLASGHQKSLVCQHFKNEWRQLDWLLCRGNRYIKRGGWSILTRRRRKKESLLCCHPTRN